MHVIACAAIQIIIAVTCNQPVIPAQAKQLIIACQAIQQVAARRTHQLLTCCRAVHYPVKALGIGHGERIIAAVAWLRFRLRIWNRRKERIDLCGTQGAATGRLDIAKLMFRALEPVLHRNLTALVLINTDDEIVAGLQKTQTILADIVLENKPVRTAAGIDNGVCASSCAVHIDVITSTTGKRIIARSAAKLVIASSATEHIIACAAIQIIIAVAADQLIIASQAKEGVVSGQTMYLIAPGCAHQLFTRSCTGYDIVKITSRRPADKLVNLRGAQGVCARRLNIVDLVGCISKPGQYPHLICTLCHGDKQVFAITGKTQLVARQTSAKKQPVCTPATVINGLQTIAGVHRIGVVAAAAMEHIIPSAAVQIIVA